MPDSCFSQRDHRLGPAASLLLPWDVGMPRAGADSVLHAFASLLQWEDTEAAAGAREEGKDEELALREVPGGSAWVAVGNGILLTTHPPMLLALQKALRIPLRREAVSLLPGPPDRRLQAGMSPWYQREVALGLRGS